MALGLRSDESTWIALPVPSTFVTMGMQYKPTKAGQEPIVPRHKPSSTVAWKKRTFGS